HAFFDVRSEIFHDYVGAFDQPHEDVVSCFFLQIEGQRAFVAMEIEHVGPIAGAAHAFVRVDAGGRFDFDDVRAKITEDAAAGRASAHASEIKHPKLCQCGRTLSNAHNTGPSF